MADKLEQAERLRAHLVAYQLEELAGRAEQLLATDPGEEALEGSFLCAPTQLKRRVWQGEGETMLLWLAADTAAYPLAQHFPRMLPFSPWGVAETEPAPFPNLAGQVLDHPHWDYVYLQLDPLADRAGQLKALLQNLEVSPPLRNRLTEAAEQDAYFDGGLFATGALQPPWAKLATGPLADLLPSVAVEVGGFVDYRAQWPQLTLRVPLLEKTGPLFGSSLIKQLSLSLELSTSLLGPVGAVPASETIGLLGQLTIGGAQVAASGRWPLGKEPVLLNFTCSLSHIADWFGNRVGGVQLPDVQVGVQLVIAKQSATLEQVGVSFGLTKWEIGSDSLALELDEVRFEGNVFAPGSLNIAMGNFAATATIGSTAVQCTGSYPDGDFYLGLVPGTSVKLSDLADMMHLGAMGLPDSLAITELSGRYNTSTHYKAFTLAIAEQATLAAGEHLKGFQLNSIRFGIYGATQTVVKLSAAFTYTLKDKTKLEFAGSAEHVAGWSFALGYKSDTGVSLPQLGEEFGFAIPQELDHLRFKELSFIADASSGQKYFHSKLAATLLGETVDLDLLISSSPTGTEFTGTFSLQKTTATLNTASQAVFTIHSKSSTPEASGELKLGLIFRVAGVEVHLAAGTRPGAAAPSISEKYFVGGTQGLNLPVSELLADLLRDSPVEIPKALNSGLKLKDIYMAYDGHGKQTSLVALGEVEGQKLAFFFQYQPAIGEHKNHYAFGISTDIGLSGLPLVGAHLTDAELAGLGFVYVSAAGSYALPALDATGTSLATMAEKSYKAGVNLTGEVRLPHLEKPFSLLPAPPTTEPASPASSQPADQPPAPGDDGDDSKRVEKWFDVDRKIGPLQVDKVGFAYADGKLFLLISAGLSLGVLACSVDGLGLGLNLGELLKGHGSTPDFTLSGLGFSFTTPTLSIDGAIMWVPKAELEERNKKADPADRVSFQFDGALTVQAAEWSLSAVASYAQLESGMPSLFIFVDVKDPLGGPPFFFVEGLMGGFGFNRTLQLPTFEQVKDFPLMAIGKGGGGTAGGLHTLQVLEGKAAGSGGSTTEWIAPKAGDYWLAAGLKFSTFKVIQGQLLLVAEFGHDLKFALLGLAQLTLPLPPEGGNAPNPYVYIELQMAAVLVPSEGFFGVAGNLTANSFVLAKDCHITGGFAYYMWFGSHPQAGQFMMTAGGYHPAFKPPAHYPQVARLGYNWQVSDYVTIRGGSYFAITPSCGMAGTSLEVLFEAGDIKAWFTAQADMMVTWHPFAFTARVAVELGASVRVSLLVCHVTVTVSIGASLDLWGSPLGGRVEVYVVVVTLTIGFGADDPAANNNTALAWPEFKALLPAPAEVCKIVANSGLTQTLQQEGQPDVWVVRAGTFSFTTQSVIPASKLTYGDNQEVQKEDAAGISVRPMNKRADTDSKVVSLHTIKLYSKVDEPSSAGTDKKSVASVSHGQLKDASKWKSTAISSWRKSESRGKVPQALWGKPLTSNGQPDGDFMQAPATPTSDGQDVLESLTGFWVAAPAPQAGSTFGKIALTELAAEIVGEGQNPLVLHSVPVAGRPVACALSGGITQLASPETHAQRTNLCSLLTASGLYAGENHDMTALAEGATSLFAENILQQL
jgi:hypothetical protein